MGETPWVVRAEHVQRRTELIRRTATKAEALLLARNIASKGFEVNFEDGNVLIVPRDQVEIISVYFEPDSTLGS